METKVTKILLRRDTEANWANSNVILDRGEPAVAIGPNNKITGLKIGDGSSTWSQLNYFTGDFESLLQRVIDVEGEISDLTKEMNGDPEIPGDTGLRGEVQQAMTEMNDPNIGLSALNNKITTINTNIGTLQTNKEDKSNKVTSLSLSSTDVEYPSAKAVFEAVAAEAHLRDVTDSGLENSINSINSKIPSEASVGNKLADKAFVNSSISTNTATFRGTYNVVADLDLTIEATHADVVEALATKMSSLQITVENNDYCFVAYPDPNNADNFTKYERYKYIDNEELNVSIWAYEFTLNNSSFTSDQWAAINSGITSELVSQIHSYSAGTGLQLSGTEFSMTGSIPYTTTAPSSANVDGGIRIIVLNSEPAQRYDGYWYIIVEEPAVL